MTREKELTGPIGEQASAAWETFHGAEQASAGEHREFAEWVARSPEHVEAYLRVSRAMSTLKSPTMVWPDTPAEELVRAAKSSTGEVALLSRSEAPGALARDRNPRAHHMRYAYALAASLILAIGVTWYAWARPQQFETAFGEQRSILLADGSHVTLNTASKIEVDLREDRRIISLVAGEALFEVAHDPRRPFDVHTGDSILRAVGTKFDVDVRRTHTTVTVIEGIVSLTQGLSEALPHGNTPLLGTSDRVVIGPAGPGTPEHGVRVDAVTAWTQRKLIFEHRALGEVAEEFNRYNRRHIVIASDRLRAEKITGVFQANDPDSFISFLSGLPGVQVRGGDNGAHMVTLDEAGNQ
jgi:transmembrane sensor